MWTTGDKIRKYRVQSLKFGTNPQDWAGLMLNKLRCSFTIF